MDVTGLPQLRALIFDKDGTLIDFELTWSGFAERMIAELAPPARQADLARVWGFDRATRSFVPTSPVIAGSNREIAELAAGVLGEADPAVIEARLAQAAADQPASEIVPLAPLLARLGSGGMRLGVMTNDAEAAARAHMDQLGVAGAFAVILGSDSGHGAKPGAGPLLAAARDMSVPPDQTAMVGDSTHDLLAGRAAGMVTIGVTSGLASADVLAPYADLVLPSIAALPEALGLD